MKTNDFDHAIRKKVGSFYSNHDQQDVDRVFAHLQASKIEKSKRRYALVGILSLILIIVGSSITWITLQIHEQAQLKKMVEHLKTDLNRSKLEKEQWSLHKDTVFVTKYSSVKNKDLAQAAEHAEKNYAEKSEAFMRRKTRTANSNLPKTTLSQLNKTSFSEHDKKTVLPDNNIASKPKNSTHRNKENREHSSQENLIAAPSPFTPESAIAKDTVPFKPGPIANDKNDKEETGTLNIKDSSFTDANLAPLPEIFRDSSFDKKNNDKHLFIPNWKYRAGIDLIAGRHQFGGGIVAEAVFKNTWNISLGLKAVKNGDEHFDDDDDFNEKKKKEFKKTYGDHVRDTSNQHIRIQNVIFQIPVTLSYNFPLKKNFSLLFGVGTDIEVYVKQHVGYNHVSSSSDIVNQSFVTHYSPVYFNNALFCAGVQKTIKKFVIQLSPYISAQIKKVTYKNESIYYGLRLRALYAF